jgi:hypothetical protein
MDPVEAIGRLRKAAVERLVGRDIGSDQLIQLGLEALLAGVDTLTLPLLAGLGRAEEPEAPGLFDQVVAELELVPADIPVERVARAQALVRWWARLIVDGELDVRSGGELIYCHSASDSTAFRRLVSSIVQYEDAVESFAIWDTERPVRARAAAAEVVARARELLATDGPDAGGR